MENAASPFHAEPKHYDVRNRMDRPRSEPREEKKQITIRDLFPGLDNDQLQEAEENLRRYFAFAFRTYTNARPAHVDSLEPPRTIEERSNTTLKT